MKKIRVNPHHLCHLCVNNYVTRWLHSDVHQVAYFYTHQLLKKLVEFGELK